MLESLAASLLALCTLTPAGAPPDDAWALVTMKGRDVAIHPRSGEQREMSPARRDEIVSPDGARIIYFGTIPGEKTIDMFIADLVPAAEPGSDPVKKDSRKLMTGALGMTDFSWTADGKDILFVSDYSAGSQVYLISTTPPAAGEGVKPRQISDSSGPCSNARAAKDGRIAWRILRDRKGKEAFYDLVISDGKTPGKLAAPAAPAPAPAKEAPGQKQVLKQQGEAGAAPPPPPAPPAPLAAPPAAPDAVMAPLAFTPLVARSEIYTFEFSPDAAKLAYSAGTSLFIHDFAARSAKQIKFSDVHEKLYAHGMHHMAWRPDGEAIAGFITFLGGRSIQAGADPYFIFGDKELFFFPVEGDAWFVARPPEANSVRWINAEALPGE